MDPMYKLLLCWRYLRTRYIALVCIVSVMLGVATMIVVNSVMAGFSHEMQQRINGMLGDLIFESHSMDGVADADEHMRKIGEAVGDDIVGMSPTVQLPALLYLDVNGESITRQVTLVGIDDTTYASVGSFGDYLQHPANREHLSFAVRDGGYDVYDHQVPKSDQSQTSHADGERGLDLATPQGVSEEATRLGDFPNATALHESTQSIRAQGRAKRRPARSRL